MFGEKEWSCPSVPDVVNQNGGSAGYVIWKDPKDALYKGYNWIFCIIFGIILVCCFFYLFLLSAALTFVSMLTANILPLGYTPSTSLVSRSNSYPLMTVSSYDNVNVLLAAGGKLPLNYVVTDTWGSTWDSTNYRWTAPITGNYIVHGGIYCNGNASGASSRLILYLNSSSINFLGHARPLDTEIFLPFASVSISLTVGDTLDVRTSQAITIYKGIYHTWFSVAMY